jgi:hypothetical protein
MSPKIVVSIVKRDRGGGCALAHLLAEIRVRHADGEERDRYGDEGEVVHDVASVPRADPCDFMRTW